MRLKSIKLAGFKSFVDPTTVPFPSNMSAIVGPNGCGKSNIIDAVRWVMGESSAKHLRGESMSDVIFNGSTARKPVGQASIELVFDNSDGGAPGEYAQFNEISVRRRVSREGQSEYFLNGARCRRRDITDLFLGTGLGPRSYAIIEQGMISRLIEAKPEELRVYIEEAASISKYKERRKETESRMRRTRENLDRLNDLRDELERQLQHLERQAQAAEKYKVLKQEERHKRAELAALRWRSLDRELSARKDDLRAMELELEKALTERISHETSLESLREEHHERTERFNRAQGRYYEAGAEIARVEQNLQHQKERIRQLGAELEQALGNRRELELELGNDEQRLAQVSEELASVAPDLELQREKAEVSNERLEESESRMTGWQQQWEEFSQRSADARQRAEVEQSRIRGVEESLRRTGERRSRMTDEKALLQEQLDSTDIEALRETLAIAREERDALSLSIEDQALGIDEARERVVSLESEVGELREQREQITGRLASHRAMLEEQLGDNDARMRDWMAQCGLSGRPRLGQLLRVREGWERAVETVLGSLIQALAVEDVPPADGAILAGAPPGMALVASAVDDSVADGTLLAMVKGGGPVADMLSKVKPVDSLAQALARREELGDMETLVTPEGDWIGRHWLRRPQGDADQTGVIERQAVVEQLEGELADVQDALDRLQSDLEMARENLRDLEHRREEARRQLNDAQQQVANAQSRLGAMEARAEQIEERLARITDDLYELEEQVGLENERLEEARSAWNDAMEGMETNAAEKEELLARRDELRSALDDMRQRARHDRDHVHQLQLQVQSLENQREGLTQTIDRMSLQRERLAERVELLQDSREEAAAPIEDLEMELEGLLERRVQEEERLASARDGLEEVDRKVREIEQARGQVESRIQSCREKLESLKMDCQALEIRSGNHIEQLKELDANLAETLENLDPEADIEPWEKELERLAGRIQRLGAINLAAIDEYRVQSERKTYLDDQHADLTEALETLEDAIRRIDRETRQRFKETFDQINRGLQELFPKVFGGGSAYLELTGEDLLETGVAIMARPPGKKNSTIHLLSGGEKALTAIALVFSIFQLTPAPFCMLDEVDAPLDDANVGRYAAMVKQMSEQLQFIYITHNKIAMEMADQLMGVTMHEPGVSRLVTVDVEEAAAMAGA